MEYNLGKAQSAAPVDPGAHFQKILAGGKQDDASNPNSPRVSSKENVSADAEELTPRKLSDDDKNDEDDQTEA